MLPSCRAAVDDQRENKKKVSSVEEAMTTMGGEGERCRKES